MNVLATSAFYVATKRRCDIADAYLQAKLGSGRETKLLADYPLRFEEKDLPTTEENEVL